MGSGKVEYPWRRWVRPFEAAPFLAFFDASYWDRFCRLTAKTYRELSAETGRRLELLQGIRELMGARPGSDDPVREDERDLVALVRAVIAMGADPVVLERHMGSRGEHARDRRGGSIQRTKR